MFAHLHPAKPSLCRFPLFQWPFAPPLLMLTAPRPRALAYGTSQSLGKREVASALWRSLQMWCHAADAGSGHWVRLGIESHRLPSQAMRICVFEDGPERTKRPRSCWKQCKDLHEKWIIKIEFYCFNSIENRRNLPESEHVKAGIDEHDGTPPPFTAVPEFPGLCCCPPAHRHWPAVPSAHCGCVLNRGGN